MVWQFSRNLVFALILLIAIGLMAQTNFSATQKAKEYLHFVLTTDFKLESLTTPVQSIFHKIKNFDFSVVANGYLRLQQGGEMYEGR